MLGRHFAEDRLDADELDRRLDLAFAGSADALAGLPPLAPSTPPRRRWGRRHGESGAADPRWMPTKERVKDPSTPRVMRVWVDPAHPTRPNVPEP